MCVELLGGTFHSPNCSLAISQASTHSFLSFCHPDWNRVSGLRAKYIPCGECRQQTPLRGGSSCLVAPLGLSMALQESGLRWKIRQLRGRAVPGPGVWFLQGKCAALLGWDPSSTWDTPPASEALGGGEWHHQNQHFSRVAHPWCWDASICTAPGLRSGRRETPSDQKCSGEVSWVACALHGVGCRAAARGWPWAPLHCSGSCPSTLFLSCAFLWKWHPIQCVLEQWAASPPCQRSDMLPLQKELVLPPDSHWDQHIVAPQMNCFSDYFDLAKIKKETKKDMKKAEIERVSVFRIPKSSDWGTKAFNAGFKPVCFALHFSQDRDRVSQTAPDCCHVNQRLSRTAARRSVGAAGSPRELRATHRASACVTLAPEGWVQPWVSQLRSFRGSSEVQGSPQSTAGVPCSALASSPVLHKITPRFCLLSGSSICNHTKPP